MECKLRRISELCNCLPWYIPRTADIHLCGRGGNQCFNEKLKSYRTEMSDCSECKDDCRMSHFFYTLQREPFSTNHIERNALFNSQTEEGLLANYLLDPKRIFSDELSQNITKFTYNVSTDKELADERFRNDIAVLNFFFDTPIITQIQQELKTTIFDMISAIGGTLGLFTGISVITIAELTWWIWTFSVAAVKKAHQKAKTSLNDQKPTSMRETSR